MKTYRIALLISSVLFNDFCNVAHADDSTNKVWKLPSCKSHPGNEDYYPTRARREGIQGRVLVEFSISQRGVVADAVVTQSDPPSWFDDDARRIVRNLRCTVPDNWQSNGGADHRFRLAVHYQLLKCESGVACNPHAVGVPADTDAPDGTIVITATVR